MKSPATNAVASRGSRTGADARRLAWAKVGAVLEAGRALLAAVGEFQADPDAVVLLADEEFASELQKLHDATFEQTGQVVMAAANALRQA